MSISNHVSLIIYDVGQLIVSPVTMEQTTIHIDLAKLGFPYHTTYAGLGPDPYLHISTLTQILQNVNGFALPESTVLHLPAPLLVDSQDVYMLLSQSPTPSAQLSFHIME